jgi:subtilase family serine protease
LGHVFGGWLLAGNYIIQSGRTYTPVQFFSSTLLHIANIGDPQIPAALAPAVHGVTSMNDFRPRSNVLSRKAFTLGPALQALVPGDLATIYNINPVYKAGISGKGQTIVVVEDSDIFSVGLQFQPSQQGQPTLHLPRRDRWRYGRELPPPDES